MSSTTSPVPHLPQNQRAPREIENHLATGELRRVRRGTYIPAAPDAPGFTSRRATREILLRAVRNERLDGVVDLGGLRVTSLERTAEDCARFLPPDRALTVVDSLFAIAAGAGERPWDRREEINARAARFRQALLTRLDARPRERGVRRARAVRSRRRGGRRAGRLSGPRTGPGAASRWPRPGSCRAGAAPGAPP